MADIFISYAREDRENIQALATRLERVGLSVWWDRNISGGAEFGAIIEKELMSAENVIVAWSENALDSHWVRDEAEFAMQQKKLLPLSLDGSMPPLGFRQIHALDFAKGVDDDTTFDELLGALGHTPPPGAAGSGKTGRAASKFHKPGVCIIPFSSLSSDAELGDIAEGICEDIATSLSTIQHIAVTTGQKPENTTEQDLSDGKPRLYVDGSIRRRGDRLRITTQLIEMPSGVNIWARKFDQSIEDFNDNPDDIVEKISSNIFVQMVSAEADRAEFTDIDDLGPWELCQRVFKAMNNTAGSFDGFQDHMGEIKRALELQPDYAMAHALLAWCSMAGYINGIFTTNEQMNELLFDFDKHLHLARRGAGDDILTLTYIGAAENFSGQQEQAVHTLKRVLDRNPAYAEAWYLICMPYACLNRFDEARHAITRAIELAPEAGSSSMFEWYQSLVEFYAGEYETAKLLVERHVLKQPDYGYACVIAALSAFNIGDAVTAAEHIKLAKRHNAHLTPLHLQGMFDGMPDKERATKDFDTLKELWAR